MRRNLLRAMTILLAAAGAGVLGGCYERVTSAQGFGADKVAVEQGNLKPDKGTRTLGYPKYQNKPLPGG